MVSFEEWWEKHCTPPSPPNEPRWLFEAMARNAWDAGRAELVAEVKLSSPALTRADILRWPESDAGLRRLRDECAKIAGLLLVSRHAYDHSSMWQVPLELVPVGARDTGLPYHIAEEKWQPDCDANQCKMLIDATEKKTTTYIEIVHSGQEWNVEFKSGGLTVAYVDFDELPAADWLLKTCLAACIAMLTTQSSEQAAQRRS